MRRLVGLALIFGATVLPVLATSAAGSQQALSVQINAVDASSYPTLLCTVTVLDGTLRPVNGLTAEAFAADVGGQAVPISGVASGSDPGLGIAVVLTFDVSGSMSGAPLAAAKEAGKSFVAQLGPSDQVAVLAFSNGVARPLAFTQDRGAATAAIDALAASGNTALYQGVTESAATAGGATLPRRAVVLLSDGLDFGGVSQVNRAASLAAAAAGGAPFYVVGLGSQIDQGYLQELATATRGALVLAPSPDGLAALYGGIGAALRQQYVLTLDGSSIRTGSTAALRITVISGGANASAEVPVTIPAVVTPPVSPPPVTRSPPPVTATPAGPGGEGDGPTTILLAGLMGVGVLALGAAGGLYLWQRNSAGAAAADISFRRVEEQPTGRLFPTVEATVTPESTAYLEIEGRDEAYALGDSPVTVGFTSDCAVHLPQEMGGTSERVSIWRREGRFMLHTLSRIGTVQVSGRPATWAILEDGDVVQLGRVRMRFHDKPPPGPET